LYDKILGILYPTRIKLHKPYSPTFFILESVSLFKNRENRGKGKIGSAHRSSDV
jgi:hypothetical protein